LWRASARRFSWRQIRTCSRRVSVAVGLKGMAFGIA
jgi:hypothetical protein